MFVVVANDQRNKSPGQVQAVRLTKMRKPAIASIVKFGHPQVLEGRAVCDDIGEVFEVGVLSVERALTAAAMARMGEGLRAALSL